MKAFPNPSLADTKYCSVEMLNDKSQYGMDLRDYFATKAMQGMLSGCGNDGFRYSWDMYAATSYEIADAMMEARGS